MYKFKFKRRLFWKTLKATGHNYLKDMDKMDVFLVGGGIYSIPNWSKYHLKLEKDWVLFVQKDMEKKTGSSINVEV